MGAGGGRARGGLGQLDDPEPVGGEPHDPAGVRQGAVRERRGAPAHRRLHVRRRVQEPPAPADQLPDRLRLRQAHGLVQTSQHSPMVSWLLFSLSCRIIT